MDWHRVDVARRSARSILAIGVLATMFAALVLIATPNWWEPTFGFAPSGEQVVWSALSSVVGIGGVMFGLTWMWRIYRAPTKSDEALWRYRDH